MTPNLTPTAIRIGIDRRTERPSRIAVPPDS